ncbi:MAG: lytic transglycosylase domain-containing protein [Candidatus Eremiobacteraeota bacterium]|nr:lytic transglycosylase domain-containing protein [Candidatus Eremiobacteraeota bacterium]
MIVGADFLALVLRCAPLVAPRTMAAIVARESGGRAFAIGDNTDRRSYFPRGLAAAQQLAGRLARAGHDLDLGYAQVNLKTARRLGVQLPRTLEPCMNLALGARVLGEDYRAARRRYGDRRSAIMHALSAYNSGDFNASRRYAEDVRTVAKHIRFRKRALYR